MAARCDKAYPIRNKESDVQMEYHIDFPEIGRYCCKTFCTENFDELLDYCVSQRKNDFTALLLDQRRKPIPGFLGRSVPRIKHAP